MGENNGWQTIDSAPKKGDVKVDLWAKKWWARDDSFMHQRFIEYYWAGTKDTGEWVRYVDGAKFPSDWFPTHWMPLPTPPQGARKE